MREAIVTKSEYRGDDPPSRPMIQIGLPDDPLGYDTSDLAACALQMAEAALSGRNEAAVAAEIAAVRRRLGSFLEDVERRDP